MNKETLDTKIERWKKLVVVREQSMSEAEVAEEGDLWETFIGLGIAEDLGFVRS